MNRYRPVKSIIPDKKTAHYIEFRVFCFKYIGDIGFKDGAYSGVQRSIIDSAILGVQAVCGLRRGDHPQEDAVLGGRQGLQGPEEHEQVRGLIFDLYLLVAEKYGGVFILFASEMLS